MTPCMHFLGAWPAFIVESHQNRFADDAVNLGEELLNNAEAPLHEDALEGEAGAGAGAAAPQGGQAGHGAAVVGGQAGAGAGDAAAAAAEGQAGAAAAEGGQGGEENLDPLDFDGIGPVEGKSEMPTCVHVGRPDSYFCHSLSSSWLNEKHSLFPSDIHKIHRQLATNQTLIWRSQSSMS